MNGNYQSQKFVCDLIQQYKFDLIIETGSHQERLIPFFVKFGIEIWAIEEDLDAYLENINELDYIPNVKHMHNSLDKCLKELDVLKSSHIKYLIIFN